MVRVAEVQGLPEGLLQAAHVCRAAPEPVRQRALRRERIVLTVARHVQPVDAAHVFPPAENLPDETLGTGQGTATGAPARLHGPTQRQRFQQADVEVHGDQAVEQPGRFLGQGVLVGAEAVEGVRQEPLKLRLGLVRGHREAEGIEIAGVVRETVGNQSENLPGGGILRCRRALGHRFRRPPAAAIIGVVVPLAALGLAIVVQEQAVAAAHLPVEVFHAQLLATLRPGGEVVAGTEKAAVLEHADRHAQPRLPARQDIGEARLPGLTDAQRRRAGGIEGLPGSGLEAFHAVLVGDVAHRVAGVAQGIAEVAHGREDQGDLVPVVSHVGGLLGHLGQEHHVALARRGGEGGVGERKLVAEDQGQGRVTHGRSLRADIPTGAPLPV